MKYITKKIYLLIISLGSIMVVSCSIGSHQQQQQGNTSLVSAEEKGINSSHIEAIDLVSSNNTGDCFDAGKNFLSICSKDSSVCGKLTVCPSAQYTFGGGMGGANYWVTKEVSVNGNFILNFNTNVESSFGLTRIYNDLSNNSSTAVGKIQQIDTTDCDKIIKSGTTAHQSCKIVFIYEGIAMNTLNNNIHFIFNDKNPLHTSSNKELDFNFKVHNSVYTNQNVPIINTFDADDSLSYLINPYIENSYDAQPELSNAYSIGIVNNGAGNLMPYDQYKNMKISVGNQFLQSKDLYYENELMMTTCGNKSISYGMSCFFNFSDNGWPSENQLTSKFARFVYQYKSFAENKVSYSHGAIVGVGEIIPKTYYINTEEASSSRESSSIIQLHRYRHTSEAASYAVVFNREDLKLYMENDATYPLGTFQFKDKLYYTDVTYQDSLDYPIKINYDKCFNNIEGAESEIDICEVKIGFKANSFDAPRQAQLRATYTGINGKKIDQIVGNILFASARPTGSYIDNCINITWDGKILDADCHTTDGGMTPYKHKTLDYAGKCDNGSTVSSDPRVEGQNWGYGDLHCDTPKFPIVLPNGDYKENCMHIRFDDGKTLTASCTSLHQPNGTFSSLNYATDCANNSEVTTGDGVYLKCVTKRPPETPPNGSYSETCKDSEMDGWLLHSQCYGYSSSFREVYKSSLLDLRECNNPSDILNISGQLMCGNPYVPYARLDQPSGTYLDNSSPGCPKVVKPPTWDGISLEATCNFNGTTITSKLNYLKECAYSSTVSFNFGELRCDAVGSLANWSQYLQ